MTDVGANVEKIVCCDRFHQERADTSGDARPHRAQSKRDQADEGAVVVQIEGASYRLRQHADLVPEHVRSKAMITPPPAPKRRGRPPMGHEPDPNAA